MTKGKLAQRILKILGINTRFSEATPEEVQDVIKYMEDWIAAQNAIGTRLGYIFTDDEPSPNEETNLPDWAIQGVTCSVAIYCAPYFGKTVDPAIARMATQGMRTISARTVELKEYQYPTRMPKGQGNNTLHGTKYFKQYDPIETFNDFLEDDGGEVITTGGGDV